MSKKDETPDVNAGSWTSAAALAGAAIGSAAVAAALLYASHRKERAERKLPTLLNSPPETD